ncbi:MAG: cytochrome c [Actinobacteria bacterium]|nr:cytochrome c [Actinomycetota bacterium]
MERPGSAISDATVVVFVLLLGGMFWLFTWLPSLKLRQEIGEWVVPPEYVGLRNQVEFTPDVMQRAREQYLFTCAKCHGFLTEGDGPQYQLLIPRPLPWSSREVNAQSEGALYYKIWAGRGDMPEYGSRATEAEIWELVHYLKQVPHLPGHYNRLDPDRPRLNDGDPLRSRQNTTVTPIPLIQPSR